MRKIYHRRHVSSGSYVRVWGEGWASDVFRVLDFESFATMKELTSSAFEFVDADEEGDE